jgi:Flp pilus assembly protein TadD
MKPGKYRGQRSGQPKSPTTEFKKLWRTLPARKRQYWWDRFISDSTQLDIRAEIAAKLGIRFKRDPQVTEIRQWIEADDSRRRDAEQKLSYAKALLKAHPGWTVARIRKEVDRRSYYRQLQIEAGVSQSGN